MGYNKPATVEELQKRLEESDELLVRLWETIRRDLDDSNTLETAESIMEIFPDDPVFNDMYLYLNNNGLISASGARL